MTSDEHIQKILDLAIEDLRQTSFVPFWKASIDVSPSNEIRTLFTDSRKNESTLISELKNAATLKEFRSFSLVIHDNERNSYGDKTTIRIHARIAEHAEWDMVLQDAWEGAENPNDWFLSDNALRLLRWIQGPKNTGQFSSENRIGGQAGLRGMGSYSNLKIYLKEISLKSPYQVSYETTSRWGGDYKISIALKPSDPQEAEFKNPTYAGRLIASDRESIQAFGTMLEDSILEANLQGDKAFLLFNIRSRISLVRSLQSLTNSKDINTSDIEKFLSKVRLSRGIKVAASLSEEKSEGWRIGAVLEDGWTWSRAIESILEQRNRPNPEELYQLTPPAAKLLNWVMNLHDDEFDLGMTPCVENVREEQLGIERLSYNQNSGAIISLIVDEINEKTNYALRLIPWHEYNSKHHRILVRRKPEGDNDLVRQIQVRGLDKGVQLLAENVNGMLEKLWSSGSSHDKRLL